MDGITLWRGQKRLAFQYRDAEEVTTDRNVVAYRIFQGGTKLYLIAHCLDRNDERHFRIDRIISEVLDKETGELAPLRDICPHEPQLDQKQETLPERGGWRTQVATSDTRSVMRKRSVGKPPYGLPVISGTTSVQVEDLTDYREFFNDYFEPRERKSVSTQAALELLDMHDIELEIDGYLEFVERALADEPFPDGISVYEIVPMDPEDAAPVLVGPDHPCLKSHFFVNDGTPTADDLMTLSAVQLKDMAKDRGLKTSQTKRELSAALIASGSDLGLFVCRLSREVATQTHRRLSLAYINEIAKIAKGLPPAYQAALWQLASDEWDLEKSALSHARALAHKAEERAQQGKQQRITNSQPLKPDNRKPKENLFNAKLSPTEIFWIVLAMLIIVGLLFI